uniref:DUF4485 domain-containing protein n=1 Tax=Macrostomum lignano TaxID=282301 RepID=A0A1I8IEK1_9PLAT
HLRLPQCGQQIGSSTMEADDAAILARRCDASFDQCVEDLKPFILCLATRQEKQLCSDWVRRLCELRADSLSEKQHRNAYADSLFAMLREGRLAAPFNAGPPESPGLPSTMPPAVASAAGSAAAVSDYWWQASPASSSYKIASQEHQKMTSSPHFSTMSASSQPIASFPSMTSSEAIMSFSTVTPSKTELPSRRAAATNGIDYGEAGRSKPSRQASGSDDSAATAAMERARAEAADYRSRLAASQRRCDELSAELTDLAERCEREAADAAASAELRIREAQLLGERRVQQLESEKESLVARQRQQLQSVIDETRQSLQEAESRHAEQVAELQQSLASLREELSGTSEAAAEAAATAAAERRSLEARLERSETERQRLETEYQQCLAEHESELGALRSKHDAALAFARQEARLEAERSAELLADQRDQLADLRRALSASESARQREAKEAEARLEAERAAERERVEARQSEAGKHAAEELARQAEIRCRLEEALAEAERRAERATAEAAHSAEAAAAEMRRQCERQLGDLRRRAEAADADLAAAGQLRERQAQEFAARLEAARAEAEERLRQSEADAKRRAAEARSEWDRTARRLREEAQTAAKAAKERLAAAEAAAAKRSEEAAQEAAGLRREVKRLKAELLSERQARQQQLLELGLLRQEETARLQRQMEQQASEARAEVEAERVRLSREASEAAERALRATDARLAELEADWRRRADQAGAALAEARAESDELRAERRRLLAALASGAEAAESALNAERERSEQRRRRLAEKLGARLEAERRARRQAEERLAESQLASERALLETEAEHQRQLQGLLPAQLQQQLEATIASLREQISLQLAILTAAIMQKQPRQRQKGREVCNFGLSNEGSPPQRMKRIGSWAAHSNCADASDGGPQSEPLQRQLTRLLESVSRLKLRAFVSALSAASTAEGALPCKDLHRLANEHQMPLSERLLDRLAAACAADVVGIDQTDSRAHLNDSQASLSSAATGWVDSDAATFRLVSAHADTRRESVQVSTGAGLLESSESTTAASSELTRRVVEQLTLHRRYVDLDIIRRDLRKRTTVGAACCQSVLDVCARYDNPVYGSVLAAVLHQCKDSATGAVRWQKFMKFLQQAQQAYFEAHPEAPRQESAKTVSAAINASLQSLSGTSSAASSATWSTVTLASTESGDEVVENGKDNRKDGLRGQSPAKKSIGINGSRSSFAAASGIEAVPTPAVAHLGGGSKNQLAIPHQQHPAAQLTPSPIQHPTAMAIRQLEIKCRFGERLITCPDDIQWTDGATTEVQPEPVDRLELDWVYGYRGNDCRKNLASLPSTGELVYPTGPAGRTAQLLT